MPGQEKNWKVQQYDQLSLFITEDNHVSQTQLNMKELTVINENAMQLKAWFYSERTAIVR